MATLQEALEGVQNGKTYVHRDSLRIREFLSPSSDPHWAGWVQHTVTGPGGGGEAIFTPKAINSLPNFTKNGWELTDNIR